MSEFEKWDREQRILEAREEIRELWTGRASTDRAMLYTYSSDYIVDQHDELVYC